jgi:hypothetical protein
MDVSALIKLLAGTDSLDQWSQHLVNLPASEKREAIRAAEPLWVARMVQESKLLVHPVTIEELEANRWVPSNSQRRMIWASVLASLDGQDSKQRFNKIKEKLIKKYGNPWWFDVYNRVKPAYAARMRLKKGNDETGPAIRMLAERTSIFSLAVHEERKRALKMIPR